MGAELDPCLAQGVAHPAPARPRERAGVGAEVHLAGVHLARERRQLALRRPAADHELAVQALAQIGEALEHELRARPGGVAPAEQALVEAEHAHHPLAAIERRAQGRMVARAGRA